MHSTNWKDKIGIVAGNQLLLEGCVFVRNIIIARFIGAESLGEFIFMVLAIRLFAMSTDLAADRYMLQVNKKQLSAALACSHFIAQVRGLGISAMLLLMGLHNIHDISFVSYALLAGSALLRGFTHQGYRLKQRSLNFRPALFVEGFTALAGTFAIFVVVSAAPCIEAVCACMLAQAGVHTAMSHILSDEKYSAVANWNILKAILEYGFPILLTGIAMFWSMQGERVILSAMMPPANFAHFSMLFQLALVPALVLGRVALTVGLPVLAAQKDDWETFSKSLSGFHTIAYVVIAFFAFFYVVLANTALTTLFGADFKAEITTIFLVGLAQSIRLCRTPQSVAAQALGQTDIPFKANLFRVMAALLGAFLVSLGASLITLLVIACIGEGVAWAAQGALFSIRNRTNTSTPEQLATLQEATQ